LAKSITSQIDFPESLPKIPRLKHLRKRWQFRRKAVSDRRKIYALDTETTQNGELLVLADNEGHYIDLKKSKIKQVLKFLFYKRYEGSWNFFWNLHFDARIILRMILAELSERDLDKFYYTFKCKIHGYSIHYIEEKKLSIRKGKHSVNYFDIAQFFPQPKLIEAYKSNIKKPFPKHYEEMKEARQDFTKDYYNRHKIQMRNYCIDDCILTLELAEHWVDMVDKLFLFYPSHWISSAYLAEKILINWGVMIPKFDDTPFEIQDLAWNCYIAGRIELVTRGFSVDCYIYDINSAFPYSLSKIPDFTKGQWIQSKKVLPNALIGFFKIKCNIPMTKHICPFFFKVRGKIIFPNGEFITYATLDEIRACEDSSWFKVLDSWQFVDDNPFYPFKKVIEELYEKRQELKRKGDPLELPIKIILNSIYGKTMQVTENKIGNLFNPIIGSTITGTTRAKLYRTIIENDMEKEVVMLYTDSITTTKKLNLDSTKLGDFSCDFHGSIYALQSGFYAKNGKFVKSRGIGQLGDETIIHKDTKIDSKGRLVYEFEKTRVGTLKLNIKNKTLENIGAFTKHKKNLKLNGDRGRHWWGKLTSVRLKERNISTPFTFPLDDPKKI